MDRVALLFGILGAPAILVALGHHLRRKSARSNHLFWGGVMGHTLGLMVTIFAMLAPPVSWMGGGQMRTLWVHWSLLAGFAIGLVLALFVRSPGPPK